MRARPPSWATDVSSPPSYPNETVPRAGSATSRIRPAGSKRQTCPPRSAEARSQRSTQPPAASRSRRACTPDTRANVPGGSSAAQRRDEHRHLAVGARVAHGAVVALDQRARGPRCPAAPERSAGDEPRRVRPPPLQHRQPLGPGEVLLDLQEVPGRRADRVGHEPRRRGCPRRHRHVNRHRLAVQQEVRGVDPRRRGHRHERGIERRGVRGHQPVGVRRTARVEERLAYHRHERLVVLVVDEEARQLDVHEVGVADVGRPRRLEGVVRRPQLTDARRELFADLRGRGHELLQLPRLRR